jgi:hypothetical protein
MQHLRATEQTNPRRRQHVKRSTKAILGGISLGVVFYFGLRRYYARRIHNVHLTSADLNYSDQSTEELVSKHLTDLNSASPDQMASLGLTTESLDRILENRPYRSKLELVSRMILSQDEYAGIKDRVSIAQAREPVKIA